jgi:hypothetical protein
MQRAKQARQARSSCRWRAEWGVELLHRRQGRSSESPSSQTEEATAASNGIFTLVVESVNVPSLFCPYRLSQLDEFVFAQSFIASLEGTAELGQTFFAAGVEACTSSGAVSPEIFHWQLARERGSGSVSHGAPNLPALSAAPTASCLWSTWLSQPRQQWPIRPAHPLTGHRSAFAPSRCLLRPAESHHSRLAPKPSEWR